MKSNFSLNNDQTEYARHAGTSPYGRPIYSCAASLCSTCTGRGRGRSSFLCTGTSSRDNVIRGSSCDSVQKRAICPGETGPADRGAQHASGIEKRLGPVLGEIVRLIECMRVAGTLGAVAQIAAAVVCLEVWTAFVPVMRSKERVVPVVGSNFGGLCIWAYIPDTRGC